MEFVEVNQDDIPNETWDGFESDFDDSSQQLQTQEDSFATSTSPSNKMELINRMLHLFQVQMMKRFKFSLIFPLFAKRPLILMKRNPLF